MGRIMVNENIFLALEKYTGENYLTAALVFVINSLLERERSVGLDILTQLCAKNNEFSFDTGEVVSVLTQVSTEQGMLDIEVSSPNKLIYIEVKDYSSVDPKQLKRYKTNLELSNRAIRHLILLTRFPVDFSKHQGIPDKNVCWFEVYNWLAGAKDKAQELTSIYLMESFQSFLEVKQMSIQKVGWEYINGVLAFNNLINMIEAAIKGAEIPFYPTYPRAAAWEYKGFYLENGEFWCGISYDDHLAVIFEIQDKKKFNTKLRDMPNLRKEGKDTISFQLRLKDIYFFSLDKDKQLEEITKFIRQCHTQAQQMRLQQE